MVTRGRQGCSGGTLSPMRTLSILTAGLIAALAAGCSGGTTTGAESAGSVPTECAPGQTDAQVNGLPVRIVVPKSATVPAPAVMVLHGGGEDGPKVQTQSEMDAQGEESGFITVYPSSPEGKWNYSAEGVAQINGIADSLNCVDGQRLYLAGFSRGSLMTTEVACSSDPRRFAAFGGVSLTDYQSECDAAPAAPWVYLHGTKDSVVSYRRPHDIVGTDWSTLPPRQSMLRWAEHNQCATGPTVSRIGSNAVLRRWTDCQEQADVDFYTLVGGDHQWPFEERPNAPMLKYGQSWAGVGATEVMWAFFESRRLPG